MDKGSGSGTLIDSTSNYNYRGVTKYDFYVLQAKKVVFLHINIKNWGEKLQKWLKMAFFKGFLAITPRLFNILQNGFLHGHQ